jgi:hypothetical protein
MPIEERSNFEQARVVYFDSRRGTGRCITRTGRHARIPLSAVRQANLITLDPGDEIFIVVDELNPQRVEKLTLPKPEPRAPTKKKQA